MTLLNEMTGIVGDRLRSPRWLSGSFVTEGVMEWAHST